MLKVKSLVGGKKRVRRCKMGYRFVGGEKGQISESRTLRLRNYDGKLSLLVYQSFDRFWLDNLVH